MQGIVFSIAFLPSYSTGSAAFFVASTLNPALSNFAVYNVSQSDVPLAFIGGGEQSAVTQVSRSYHQIPHFERNRCHIPNTQGTSMNSQRPPHMYKSVFPVRVKHISVPLFPPFISMVDLFFKYRASPSRSFSISQGLVPQ